METNGRKIVIIGSGIAGLCTAVYALKSGYEVEVLEMHDVAGGLATSWRRGPYTFETCLHWLVGSKPGGEFHAQWEEVCDIGRLTFIDPREFVRIETEDGDRLTIWTDVDRLEEELLLRAPQDAHAILELTESVRNLRRFRMLDLTGSLTENWRNLLRDLPVFPLLNRLSKMSGAQYAERFSDPLLRRFFSHGDIGKMSAIAMVLTLAWMHTGNAGYCIGGSQALIRLIEERIVKLGGRIRFNARVRRILVEQDTAVGAELEDGETIPANWVVSAADGHATIFEMLGSRYADPATWKLYDTREPFASYLQVSLGVARDLGACPPMVARVLQAPLRVDPATEVDQVGFRIFHFDPTFAPKGKTAVTSLFATRNAEFWTEMREKDAAEYQNTKDRLAEAVIAILERVVPEARGGVEVVDVSTPATVIRYTGNWRGSMEGWLVEPGTGFHLLPNTLPGLKRFVMAGQWVLPGGGLPCGPITARAAVKLICREDHMHFAPHQEMEEVSLGLR